MSGGVVIGIDPTKVRTSAEGPEFVPGTVGAVMSNPSTGEGGVKKYRYVRYRAGAGTIASVAGRVASNYAPGGVSTGVCNEVTMDGSDSGGIGMGVLQAVIAADGYGWIQTKGKATLSVALTAGADGNALTRIGAGADDGSLDVSALVSDAIVAYAVDASASIILCDFPE